MRNKLKALKEKHQEVTDNMQALLDSHEDGFDDEQQAAFDGMAAESQKLKVQIENEVRFLESQASLPTVADANVQVAENQVADNTGVQVIDSQQQLKLPAVPRARGTLKCFTGEGGEKRAFEFGMFLMAAIGNPVGRRYAQQRGLPMKQVNWGKADIGALYQEGDNTAGGYLVWPELDSDIIRLVESYGVCRRLFRTSPMASETKSRNRRTGGLTATFVGEGAAGTESTGSWDQVALVAKKLMVLSRMTNEWAADTIISEADNFAVEAAQAMATKEDQCGLIGDGTSTYGGIEGITVKLLALNGVDDGGGLVLAAGNLMSEVTLANLNAVIGRVPAQSADHSWAIRSSYRR
jgi:HK97 family phage major capsid protein